MSQPAMEQIQRSSAAAHATRAGLLDSARCSGRRRPGRTWHDEGAAVGGAFTGMVRAALARMLDQAPALAGTGVTATGVAWAVSRRPRR